MASGESPWSSNYRDASIVTDQAVFGCLFLLVAIKAESHRVVHDPFGHSHLRNVSMTGGTLDSGSDVRGVVEAHMSLFVPSIHPLPRRLLISIVILRELLDRRVLRGDEVMAIHAESHARNVCDRSLVHSVMAVDTVERRVFDVNFMAISEWLDRIRPDVKEVSNSFRNGLVGWRKDRRNFR
jgi:hypothetical protein